MLRIETIVSVPFDENTYILWLEGQSECVIVDPGLQPAAIIKLIDEQGLVPAVVLLTHGHSDHIAGNGSIKERWPHCPLVIGAGDASKLTDPVGNLSAGFGFEVLSPPADQTVTEGETYEAAGLNFSVLETPGHSAGHVTFLTEIDEQTHVISGDVLFSGSVGRSDFPDGNAEQLRASIHNKLFPLGDEAIVYPGHGPTTTIGKERQSNPFVGKPAGFDG